LAQATLAFRGVNKNASLSASALAAVLDRNIQKEFADRFSGGVSLPSEFDGLQKDLGAFHLTIAELIAFAKSQGIELLDEKGKFVGDSFDRLAQKIGLTIAELTTFGNSVSGLGRFLTLQDQLLGKTSPLDTLERDCQQLEKLFPAQAAFLESLNLASEAGQQALKDFLLQMNQAFEDGTIDVKTLNGSIDDFTTVAGDAAGALNALGDATNAAVAGMLNVPTGFKLAAAEFKAALDQDADALAKSLRRPILDPGTLFRPRVTLTPLLNTRTSPSIETFNANITVVQQPGENAEILAKRIEQALRDRARSQTGDTQDFGRLF